MDDEMKIYYRAQLMNLQDHEIVARLEYSAVQLEQIKLYAHYHMALGTSPHPSTKQITRGDGHVYSQDEIRQDYMNTALRHIQNLEEVAWWRSEAHLELGRRKSA